MTKYKLVLEEIGKFKNCSFDLNDITVFHGPNEAGKTTLIDALIHCLATVRKNQYLYSHILEPRYGSKIKCRLKLNSNNEEVAKVDHDLVKNLLLVRSSSLDLEFTQKSGEASWVEEVRHKLFSGGVNPQKIVDAIILMEKKTKGSGSPLFEHKKIEEEISEIEEELKRKKAEIQSYATAITKQEELVHREEELYQQLSDLDHQLKVKTEKLKFYKKLNERREVNSIQEKLSEKNILVEIISKNSSFTEDRYVDLKSKEEALKKLDQQRDFQKNELARKTASAEELQNEYNNFLKHLNKLSPQHDLAKRTQLRLEEMVSMNETKKTHRPKGPYLVALALLVIGVSMLMTMGEPLNYLGLVFIAVATGLLWWTSLGKKDENSTLDLKAEIRFFNQQYKVQPGCPDSSYAHAIDFLREIVDSYVVNGSKLELLQQNAEKAHDEVKQIKSSLLQLEKNFNDTQASLKDSMPSNLEKSEDFYKLVQKRANDSNKLKELDTDLKNSVTRSGFNTMEELSQHVTHKIIEFNNDPISHEDFSQKDVSILEQEIAKLSESKAELSSQVNITGKELVGTNKEIQLTLNTLSIKQVELEKRLHELKETRDKRMLEMDSMRLLRSIVSEIGEDASEKFTALSEGINKYLSVILDGPKAITLTSLGNLSDIKCEDHYGQSQEATHLSSGTRDAFVLSARLALLEKVKLPKDAFLILDDPFVLMDAKRQLKAIKAIKQFHDDSGTPIVFFTKDEIVRDLVGEQFMKAEMVELIR